ncbi:MAG TPA: argininosuccinate synthase [Gaiellales bacterium]|nr:argininosuccinate synthase [Gaiellales bacterium]
MKDTIVLAYSGGLDTSVALRWLADEYSADVVALLVDVGQGIDTEQTTARALQAGAAEVVIVDARAEFAAEYVLPILQAGALYEGRYPLVSALSRPLIAKHLVAVAAEHGASAVAHGCTGKGNDQVRFETAVAALAPALAVLAPVRDWGMTREQEIAYAAQHGIEVPVKSGAAYSVDQNLWGRSIEAGPLEDPWAAPPDAAFALTMTAEKALAAPQVVEIAFEQGVPVAIDGEALPLPALIGRAAAIAGAHGVGRLDMIENRLVGIKSREIYEVPAAALLLAAYAGVEELVAERDLAHTKQQLALQYATLVYNGLWFSPLRAALQAFMAQTTGAVTGVARVKLYRGGCTVIGRKAEASLYDHSLATYEEGDAFQHGAAAGFIHVWSLSTKTWAAANAAADTVEV